MTDWIERWGDMIASEPEVRGVWRRKDGGFHVRGRASDPNTGTLREVNRALPDCKTATKAAAELEAQLTTIRKGVAPKAAHGVRFAAFAVELFERKIHKGQIASAAGREKWHSILTTHLIPTFGDWYLDKITKREIEAWLVSMGKAGYAPSTTNTALAVLKTILSVASKDYAPLQDPSADVDPVETKTHETYTDEEPNSFAPEDVMRFLDEMRVRWPEHWAMTCLGMWTGWRPSELRPLRHKGPHSDLDWNTGKLTARRSHTIGDETMAGTKNLKRKTVKLPPDVLDALRWHVDELAKANAKRAKRDPDQAAAMAASDLLFPARPTKHGQGGGFRSKSCLKTPFADVAKAIGLPHKATPRALRRSFQDLCREAGVPDATARAICGHKTSAMQIRYSSVRANEHEAAMGKIIELASARRAKSETPPETPPERSDMHRHAPKAAAKSAKAQTDR